MREASVEGLALATTLTLAQDALPRPFKATSPPKVGDKAPILRLELWTIKPHG